MIYARYDDSFLTISKKTKKPFTKSLQNYKWFLGNKSKNLQIDGIILSNFDKICKLML